MSNSKGSKTKSRYLIDNTNNYVFKRMLAILDLRSTAGNILIAKLLKEGGVNATKNRINQWCITDQSNKRYNPISDELLKKIMDIILDATTNGAFIVYHQKSESDK